MEAHYIQIFYVGSGGPTPLLGLQGKHFQVILAAPNSFSKWEFSMLNFTRAGTAAQW